jgi:hypothetical protein
MAGTQGTWLAEADESVTRLPMPLFSAMDMLAKLPSAMV